MSFAATCPCVSFGFRRGGSGLCRASRPYPRYTSSSCPNGEGSRGCLKRELSGRKRLTRSPSHQPTTSRRPQQVPGDSNDDDDDNVGLIYSIIPLRLRLCPTSLSFCSSSHFPVATIPRPSAGATITRNRLASLSQTTTTASPFLVPPS